MNKRQKRSSLNVNIPSNTNSKQIIDDNPISSSNLTNDIKEELSSTSNHKTIVNDNVPDWFNQEDKLDELIKKIHKTNLLSSTGSSCNT